MATGKTVKELRELLECYPDDAHIVIALTHEMPHPGKFEITDTWHDGGTVNIITGASACRLTEDFWRENELANPRHEKP